MAYIGEEINLQDIPQSDRNFDPLPEGWYTVTTSAAELRQTKAGDGSYISVRYDVVGPTHQGRVVFGNINIRNKNAQAENIGREKLGQFMRAVGLAKVQDTDQMIGHTLEIKLKVRPAKDGFDAGNDVSGFSAVSGSVMQSLPASTPQSQQQAPASPAGSRPPWAR